MRAKSGKRSSAFPIGNVRYDHAIQAQIIWGANLIPLGAACGGDDPRRKPARSRAPAKCVSEGSDGRHARDAPAGALGVAASSAAAVRFGNSRTKSPPRIAPCGLCNFRDDGVVTGGLPGMPNRFQILNKFRKIRRKGFDKLKLPSVSLANKKCPPLFSGRAVISAMNMHLICPTRQAGACRVAHKDIERKSLSRGDVTRGRTERKEDVNVLRCCRAHCSIRLVLCSGPSRNRFAWYDDVSIR